MLTRFYSKLFGFAPKTIQFVLGNPALIRKRLFLTVPITVWTAIFYQLSPLLIKFQVDSLTNEWENILGISFGSVLEVFMVFVGIYIFIYIIDTVLTVIQEILLYKLKQDTTNYLEDKFNQLLATFDGAFLSGENNLRIIRSLQWNLGSLQGKMVDFMANSIELVVGIIALVLIIPFFHIYLLVYLIIAAVLEMIIDALQNWRWRQFEIIEQRQSDQKSELQWRYIWYFNIFLQNNWLDQVLSIYKQKRANHNQTELKQHNTNKQFDLIKNSLSSVTSGIGTLLAGYLVIQGEIPIGTFVVFSFYVSRLRSQFELMSRVFKYFFEIRFDLFRYDFLLHLRPKLDTTKSGNFEADNIQKITLNNISFVYPSFFDEEKNYIAMMQNQLGLLPKEIVDDGFWSRIRKLWQKLVINNLSNSKKDYIQKELEELNKIMTLSDNNKNVLNSLNLTFEKGKVYGIVGYNGAGKTTLMKLLKRSLDVSDGQILVDGIDLKRYSPDSWRQNFASLEQNSYLIDSLSVLENMQIGSNRQVTPLQVKEIFAKLGIDKYITDPNVVVGEGVELSGGQQQMLEIARILLHKKPIVILDEGTNQMDAQKESKIFEIIKETKAESITLFISHRMTTINKCDQIVILEDGKITQVGSPKSLLEDKNSNLFQEFWKLQVE
jgi:ABC-type multidrug transport system fused ATPase/permease subunit